MQMQSAQKSIQHSSCACKKSKCRVGEADDKCSMSLGIPWTELCSCHTCENKIYQRSTNSHRWRWCQASEPEEMGGRRWWARLVENDDFQEVIFHVVWTGRRCSGCTALKLVPLGIFVLASIKNGQPILSSNPKWYYKCWAWSVGWLAAFQAAIYISLCRRKKVG